MLKRTIFSAAVALAVSATSGAAGEAKPAGAQSGAQSGDQSGDLPGVTGGYAIVRPAPAATTTEAERTAVGGGRGTTFRVGDFDVTVSGSISVEIGFGQRPPGGRR